MKRSFAITAAVVLLAFAAAACGGGGSVTIPSRIAAVETEPASIETYCALESEAVGALKPFLKDGASPLAAQPALVEAAALASQVALVGPNAIAVDLATRSRVIATLLGAVAADRYDVGSLGQHHPALIMRSPRFLGVLERIDTYDGGTCNFDNG